MAIKSICIAILLALLCFACSEEASQSTTPQTSEMKSDVSTAEQTEQGEAANSPFENISLEELTKDKLSACVTACSERTLICDSGCDFSCRKQCVYEECNFTDRDRKTKCKKECYARCDEGIECGKYCSNEMKSCVSTCPLIHVEY